MVSLLLLLIQTRTLQQIGKNVFIKMNEKKKNSFFFIIYFIYKHTFKNYEKIIIKFFLMNE